MSRRHHVDGCRIDVTLTSRWRHVDVTLTSRWRHVDVTSTSRRRHVDVTSTSRWRHVDVTLTSRWRHVDAIRRQRTWRMTRCYRSSIDKWRGEVQLWSRIIGKWLASKPHSRCKIYSRCVVQHVAVGVLRTADMFLTWQTRERNKDWPIRTHLAPHALLSRRRRSWFLFLPFRWIRLVSLSCKQPSDALRFS